MSGIRALVSRLRALVMGGARPVVEPQAFGYADLRGGGSRIAITPQLGGRISALEMGGREWLVPSTVTAAGGISDPATRDGGGGFDECYPTVIACTIPSWVQRFGGITLPDRGELVHQRPRFQVHTENGPTAITTWLGERMPYEITRVVRVSSDGAVSLGYRATNLGKEPIPFLWSAQPILPMTAETRIVLPDGALARIGFQQGIDLGAGAREQRWPRFRLGDKLVDMSRPDSIPGRFACKIFLEMPREPVAIEEGDDRLEIAVDAGQVPNLGVWINRGGWPASKLGSSRRTLSLQPCIGAPDSLADALGDWKSVHWLAPGEAREWRLTFRVRPLTSEMRASRETPAESRLRSR